jgi:L-fuconolactonase
MLARFTRAWPSLPVVIDHAAKPSAARGGLDPWRDQIAALADLGCYCKLSGLRTEQAVSDPPHALIPYVDHLVARFGARLMWGSDWPVIGLVGESWRAWFDLSRDLAASADAEHLFVTCARDFYALSV